MGDARIVITTLIDEKLLTPGSKKLYVSYYRKRVYADLLADGSIRFKDQVYTSPVPCALHMKRTLNPSLKTDAGWSSMFSTASGESLKDIKDRLNIRKRGTNVRSAHKDKKAPTPLPTAKERVDQAAAASAIFEVIPKCVACRKEATVDVSECSACHSKTHWKCTSSELEATPPTPWFCEKCLTGQANRILEFLQQTRRVLIERIIELKEKKEEANETEVVTSIESIQEKEQEANERKTARLTETIEEEDCSSAENDEKPFSEDKYTGDAAALEVNTFSVAYEEKTEESSTDGAPTTADDTSKATTEPSATADSLSESTAESSAEPFAAYERKASEASVVRDADDPTREEILTEQKDAATNALEEKEMKQEAIGLIPDVRDAKEYETLALANKEDATADESIVWEQLVVTKTAQASSAEEKFLVLIDSLIAEVSSKNDRADVIANTTGAMLVHLEKTQSVQLVEYGKREILAATQPESEEDEEQGDEADDEQDGTAVCNNSEVGALIKIFDLRHQILSSQSQFERTTSALAKRTEIHLRDAETKIMELEESRTVETKAITKVADLITQYSSDLGKCKRKKYYNEVLLESINHRRNYIRSTNINDRFVPSYRYSTKLMTTSSDQLLLTVLLEKLRDITESVNEWTKMERHFGKMTSSLNESLLLIGKKRKRTGAPVKSPPTSALFPKVKIPPSRRLIERQIANYQVNLNSIRQERAQMRNTLFGILKIAREEHLSEEIIRMTNMLYQKCRDLKAEEEEEQLRLKEEAAAVAETKASEEEDAVRDRQSTDDGEASAEELQAKRQRLSKGNTAFDSNSGSDANSAAAVASNGTLFSEMKGISLLLGSEDLHAKDPNYNAAETKSRAENDEDSEEDLEQASRAIADITSSVLPDISGGSGSRVDLLNSSLMTERLGTDSSRVFTSPGHFMIRGGRGSRGKRETLAHQSAGQHQNQPITRPSGQNHPSFLDQALEALSKQHRPEQPRLEQQRQLGQHQNQLEEHSHQLERQRQLEQQRLLEHQRLEKQHHDRERQEWDRHERDRQENARIERKCLEKQQRLERQHIEKQRLEQERREQQRREQLRLERYEEQLIEQQGIEEQQRVEEQRRSEQQRLEQQRLEKRQRLEQQKQRLEQQRHEEQRQQQQQRKEKQWRQQEQQRLELELQCRQQDQQRQEQERQFQHSKPPSLPQVIPSGSSHLQMLSQQQQLQQQQAALQHSRQLQHPLYGDMSKGMIMSSAMGTSQQDVYAQQAAQMGMDMHDIVRHQDSSLFGGSASSSLRAGPAYMSSNEVSRSAASQPAPTAPRTSFYGDDGHAGQLHSQALFGSQLSGQQRQLSDHHMFTNELQQQQPDQPRPPMGNQDFIIGRSYRGLSDNMQHPSMDQSDGSDVNMGDWGQ